MKSFGVRLGAGLVTIIFGAYAAALAQKDKENSSGSWTAQAPSLGEPAAPIAGMSEETWLAQPADGSDANGDAASGVAQASATFAVDQDQHDDVFGTSRVALVQHSEDIPAGGDGSGFAPAVAMEGNGFAPGSAPASLGNPEASYDPGAATDWSMPSADAMSEPAVAYDDPSATTQRSLSMTFPTDHANANPESSAPVVMDPSVMAPSAMPMGSNPADAMSGDGLPTLKMAQTPQVDYFNDTPQATGNEGPADYAAPQPMSDPSAMAQGNLLRDQPMQDNDLRGGMPAPAPPAEGFAPPAEGFASPAEDFAMQNAPPQSSAGTFAPQGEMAYQADPAASQPVQPMMQDPAGQTFAADQSMPPARMASLPTGNALPSGMSAQPSVQANQPYGDANAYQPQPFAQPTGAVEIDPNSVVDSPGDRRLEGIQSPSVVIHKRAPAEVTVGKPASFVIQVQNVGSAEALDVKVHDRIPAGMRLVDASPAPVQQGSLLMWQLGALPAGDERTVTMQLVPETEGELGSVARVTFEAAASVRTMSTRPELKIVQRALDTVLIGQQLEIELEVSNPGTGSAEGVSLQVDVPEGLSHPKGRQLDNMIGTLAPGEVRTQVLRLQAVSPGMVQNTIRLVSQDGLSAEDTIKVEVTAPNLAVELNGPSLRYLERQVTYQLEVANNGTDVANNVELSVQLDRGFTFVSTDSQGQYDPSRHSVYWSLATLAAGAGGSVPLTLLPVEQGARALTVDARADLGVVAKCEKTVQVEGLAELSFQITNPGGPIEMGAETSYEITVNNSGSKPDEDVRVELLLPPGLELIDSDSDAGTDGRGLVAFQPRAQLKPGEEMKFRVRVRGVAQGTHLVKAVVVSKHETKPVTKEESTLVYADQ
ncbi:Large cysteine-rich periplasmic protein OmcB precursor [Rubripirellula lacrimiformis]|uniref:Large cysteine-rich periplasmic protein OmcB n=1 Tax=Rubripirellula lacrimiformis TaxID=1930273 RepID=A0A517NCQ1_9BACT|nr:DUF11 domain-containing protein [Rubripirellula lacrimiformis]QDT04828.1 Large cysteine-rich periplasmic protein OmcB precursor [Rubripirellula lacrimiformis]